MTYRISPAWWPVIAVSSPVLIPLLMRKNHRFKQNRQRSHEVNTARIKKAKPLAMPPLDHCELTVLVEQKTEPGFLGAPGVSYRIKTDQLPRKMKACYLFPATLGTTISLYCT